MSSSDFRLLAAEMGRALSLDFTERESFFLGGEYFRAQQAWGEVVVRINDAWDEPARPDAQTLVEVDTDAF